MSDELRDKARNIDTSSGNYHEESGQRQEINVSFGVGQADTENMRNIRRVVEMITIALNSERPLETLLQLKHDNPQYADMIDDAVKMEIAGFGRRLEKQLRELSVIVQEQGKIMRQQIETMNEFQRRLNSLENNMNWRTTALFIFVLAITIVWIVAAVQWAGG